MQAAKVNTKNKVLDEKTERLIAIGAAMAANCIPCFEHLYENAITSGILAPEIRRVSEIAAQVKNGAHAAIAHSIDELIGIEKNRAVLCQPPADDFCSCR